MGDVVSLLFADGSVGRMQFTGSNLSDEAVQAAINKGGFPAGAPVSWRRVSLDDFPADPTFRNAWTDSAGKIEVDMPKAREIAHEMRRANRAEEFAPLDKQINIDIVSPAKVAATEAVRQSIRDKYAAIQLAIDEAKDPDEIKAVLKG